ncbi:hypothetical protein QBC40DRAFT_8968 [Triangularia verruculosa]|uniref:WIBG Mago-binding domain-containing protein n=1 Tax=Triangularia verruculosa TaxID=2587418 RepID=A0AAN7AWM3_9PEZI|nr:hypothetical protein QBC40DRAFT_8968 [Triangularia verruculosa]
MPSQPTNAGIVTDETSGERHIPESVRADGSTRKAIKIRPGYRPPEDVEVYKNRAAENFRTRGKGPPPGSEGLKEEPKPAASAASNKNAKRREAARKKSQAAEASGSSANAPEQAPEPVVEELDPEAEKEKKVRNLKKKLKQVKELQGKKEGGTVLLPEQLAKLVKMNELIRELESLGFDSDGEPKNKEAETTKDKAADD